MLLVAKVYSEDIDAAILLEASFFAIYGRNGEKNNHNIDHNELSLL